MSKIMEIKELQKDFIGRGEVKGFKFTQINATDKAFLYKVNSGDSIYYEVFKRRLNSRFATISYPSSKAFGLWAWCVNDFNKAVDKFNSLNEEVSNGEG